MYIVKRNQQYPGELPPIEGAVAEFLKDGESLLIITLPGITDREAWAINQGKTTVGLLHKNDAILFLWQFRDKKNNVALMFETSFDARKLGDRITRDITVTKDTRLLIGVHMVDRETKIVRGLRAFTLPKSITLDFFLAVNDQLDSDKDSDAQVDYWMQKTPDQLHKLTKHLNVGE